MTAGRTDRALVRRLGELRREHGDTIRIDALSGALADLMDAARSEFTSDQQRLFDELAALDSYIEAARAEIASLRPDEVKDKFIPSATDELDAIVEATADATNEIMDAAEIVDGVIAEVDPALAERLGAATTKIYEACTFQDITGQRITKVVTALKHIEERIDALVGAFGDEIAKVRAECAPAADDQENRQKQITDADLLEGPQLPSGAKSQEDIDALLASLK